MKGFGFDLKQSGGYVWVGGGGGWAVVVGWGWGGGFLSVIELGLSAMASVFH